MVEAFVWVFVLLYLKIVFHIQIALKIFFPKHILLLLLHNILLSKNLFWQFVVLKFLKKFFFASWGELTEEGSVDVVFVVTDR